jgi:hypothetical protein
MSKDDDHDYCKFSTLLLLSAILRLYSLISQILYQGSNGFSIWRAGSSEVVMFGSQPKGRGFKSRPVHKTLCMRGSGRNYAQKELLLTKIIHLIQY